VGKKIFLPTDRFHLFANYFGDLLENETGKTPLEYFSLKILDLAKENIFSHGESFK
jgi:hypothetical protein